MGGGTIPVVKLVDREGARIAGCALTIVPSLLGTRFLLLGLGLRLFSAVHAHRLTLLPQALGPPPLGWKLTARLRRTATPPASSLQCLDISVGTHCIAQRRECVLPGGRRLCIEIHGLARLASAGQEIARICA